MGRSQFLLLAAHSATEMTAQGGLSSQCGIALCDSKITFLLRVTAVVTCITFELHSRIQHAVHSLHASLHAPLTLLPRPAPFSFPSPSSSAAPGPCSAAPRLRWRSPGARQSRPAPSTCSAVAATVTVWYDGPERVTSSAQTGIVSCGLLRVIAYQKLKHGHVTVVAAVL